MTLDELRAVDRSGMYDHLRSFPDQVRHALEIAGTTKLRLRARGIDNIVLTGLGGSAIGGDLLRSYLAAELRVPFLVNRAYTLPRFVGRSSLVIVSSYSGNTEETLAAHREALRRNAKILCISSGGSTTTLAERKRSSIIRIPGGLPPRAALGYSFFPLLLALIRMGFIPKRDRDIRETLTLLGQLRDAYADPTSAENRALQLAQQIRGRIGVVYSSTERFDAVNTRWRGQMAENGKSLLFGNVLPEMNHNELVGWKALGEQMREMQVIFLRDRGDHPRIQRRLEITKEVLAGQTAHIAEVWTEGRSLLARMFSLICLGDWTSFYLAVLHGEDPTPIAVIEYLKNELGKS
jgi:glucose/mannose-6-phosphate isomerase